MEGIFVAKVVAGVFLALLFGIPLILFISKPRKQYRRTSKRRQQRMAAGMYAFIFMTFLFSVIAFMIWIFQPLP